MQNMICLNGRLVRDPEAKNVSGKSLVTATIAVDKEFKKEGKDTANFFNLKVWGQPGDFLQNYGGKGRLVAVSGPMECDKYVDKEGNNREFWYVNVLKVSVLDRPRESAEGESTTSQTQRSTTSSAQSDTTTTTDDGLDFDPFAP